MQRHPGVGLTLGVSVMLVAAIPIFGLHIGQSGVTTLPANMPSRIGYTALQREFPASSPYPIQIVTQGGGPAAARGLSLNQGIWGERSGEESCLSWQH